MENIKKVICDNLVLLRKSKNLTQKELANKINYSDKAISRWELGESLPSIETLMGLCDFYNVEFEWLIAVHKNNEIDFKAENNKAVLKIATAVLFAVCCFTLATIIFVYNQLTSNTAIWQAFVWAVPVSLSIVGYCSYKWWSPTLTLIFVSLSMWAYLTSVFVTLLYVTCAWPLFLLGIPFQIIIILLAIIKNNKSNKWKSFS